MAGSALPAVSRSINSRSGEPGTTAAAAPEATSSRNGSARQGTTPEPGSAVRSPSRSRCSNDGNAPAGAGRSTCDSTPDGPAEFLARHAQLSEPYAAVGAHHQVLRYDRRLVAMQLRVEIGLQFAVSPE